MQSTVNLNAKGNQSKFADLVGVTQASISVRVKKGLLPRDGNMGEWLALYCDQLRKEAAGRSGEAQDDLTRARIEEAKESAAEKRQRRLKDARNLLQRNDVEVILLELPRLTRSEMILAAERIHDSIESKHGIKLGDEDILEPIRSALGHIGTRALELHQLVAGNEG